MKHVYLAGPIVGCNKAEANDWRKSVDLELMRESKDRIRGISPLRCEPIVGERYLLNYEDPKFGTARAIGSKNMADVRWCDMVLAYLPILKTPNWTQSYGALIELGWAHALNKPIIIVSDDPKIIAHPVTNACAGWVLSDLDDAVDVVIGLLHGYEGGKNV